MFEFKAGKYPTACGVYLMQDASGQILYVGKAKNLRNRLRSYFSAQGDGRVHIRFLVEKISAIETIVTDTEKEALLLENTLIKKHRPRYNIDLRDDKTYVSVRLDPNEEFPALQVVRRVRKDGARYFGPYASAGAIRKTLKEIYRLFPLRHHTLATCRARGRPCLYYQIGQCSGPCHGLIGREDYMQLVDGVTALLEGREGEVRYLLQQRMAKAAAEMRYEEAARLRDQMTALDKSVERQKVTDAADVDQDVFGIHREGGEVEVAVLFVRRGKLTGKRTFGVHWRLDEEAMLENFLQQFYGREIVLPDEILLPVAIEGAELIADWLSEKRGKKVHLLVPQRGGKKKLVSLASRNAKEAFHQRGSQKEARETVLKEIADRLHLRQLPLRIECFDISNIQGAQAVGSMAVLLDGETANAEYRHYRIRTVEGSDDFASLAEVLRRRLLRGIDEGGLPDMLLIDGGKGQLSAAAAVLDEVGLSGNIDLVSIAKSRVKANVKGKVVEKSEERFFLPGRKNPVVLRRGSPALFLLERLRDEAHRFAIIYHRKLRSKATLKSSLEDVPGVGPGRRQQLLKYFGSLKKVKQASLEELQAMPGLSEKVAREIFNTFKQE
jgi:excinuclease ABC subunit C